MLYIYRHPNLCVFQVRKISVDYPNAEDVLNLDDAREEIAFVLNLVCQLSQYLNAEDVLDLDYAQKHLVFVRNLACQLFEYVKSSAITPVHVFVHAHTHTHTTCTVHVCNMLRRIMSHHFLFMHA